MFKINYFINKYRLENGGRYCVWALCSEQTDLKIDSEYYENQFQIFSEPQPMGIEYQYVISIECETQSGWKEIFSSVFPFIDTDQFKLAEAFIEKYLKRNYKKNDGDII
jgi:hypothetical protein